MFRSSSRLWTLASLVFLAQAIAPPSANGATGGKPALEVVEGGWGGGEPVEIGKVAAAVAELFPAPAVALPLIRIRHRFGGPMVSYDRDRDGSIVVYLSARDSRWYQYIYQFAHEYCHLLSRFDRKQQGEEIVRDQQWFEESLCETASLYALRRLAATWRDAPPDVQLRDAAALLAKYADQLLDESHRWLDGSTTLAQWYSRNQATLRRDPYARETNEVVATKLLPLFEQDPRRWAALAHLNTTRPVPGQSFADFLAGWSAASPPDLRPFVAEIRALFGV